MTARRNYQHRLAPPGLRSDLASIFAFIFSYSYFEFVKIVSIFHFVSISYTILGIKSYDSINYFVDTLLYYNYVVDSDWFPICYYYFTMGLYDLVFN